MADMASWLSVPADHPCLAGHFPGHPVVPGVLILSYVWEEIGHKAGRTLVCAGWPSVKFLAPLEPAEPFTVAVEFGSGDTAKFVCKTAQRTIAQGSARLAPETPT